MVSIIINYYKVRNKRYLRVLNIEGKESFFINSPLNLSFLNIKRKSDLVKDFEMCRRMMGNFFKW